MSAPADPDRWGKLARLAYYQAIDGRAHDHEWPTLNPDERDAWKDVAFVILNAAPGAPEHDRTVLSCARAMLVDRQVLRVTPALCVCKDKCVCGNCVRDPLEE